MSIPDIPQFLVVSHAAENFNGLNPEKKPIKPLSDAKVVNIKKVRIKFLLFLLFWGNF